MGRFHLTRGTKYAMGAAVVLLYGYIALRGPQGIQPLLEKRQEIRQLQEQNAERQHELDRRKDRIRRLEQSSSEQEMEIRKQLKLLKKGETTFIISDTPDQQPAPDPQP